MKRKILGSAIAIGLSVASAVSFVGCGEGKTWKEVGMADYLKVVHSSFENYCMNRVDVTDFAETGVEVSVIQKQERSFERSHTPDGETTPVSVIYTDVLVMESEMTLAIKEVNDVLCLRVDVETSGTQTYYDEDFAPENEPLIQTVESMTRNTSLVFGFENDIYYVKAMENFTLKADGEDGLDETTLEKTYTTFADLDEYYEELQYWVDEISNQFIFSTYMLFSEDSLMSYNGMMNTEQSGDEYRATLSVALPTISTSLKEFSCVYIGMTNVHTKNAPKSFEVSLCFDEPGEKTESLATVEYLSKATLKLDANALDGYERDDNLDPSDYLVDMAV